MHSILTAPIFKSSTLHLNSASATGKTLNHLCKLPSATILPQKLSLDEASFLPHSLPDCISQQSTQPIHLDSHLENSTLSDSFVLTSLWLDHLQHIYPRHVQRASLSPDFFGII